MFVIFLKHFPHLIKIEETEKKLQGSSEQEMTIFWVKIPRKWSLTYCVIMQTFCTVCETNWTYCKPDQLIWKQLTFSVGYYTVRL